MTLFVAAFTNSTLEGIFEQLNVLTKESDIGSSIKFGNHTLLVREEWNHLKNEILSPSQNNRPKTVHLKGSTGRGKSSFVYYLIFCMLLQAKAIQSKASQANPPKKRKVTSTSLVASADFSIGYVCNGISDELVKFVINLSGYEKVAALPTVDCLIADIKGDVASTDEAKLITMAVSADDLGKIEFNKRVDEDNGDMYCMPSPTVDQMKQIFLHLDEDPLSEREIEFRLNVVGCNPRLLGSACTTVTCSGPFEYVDALVSETYDEILRSSDDPAQSAAHLEWIKFIVKSAVEIAYANKSERSQIEVSSVFLEYVEDGDWRLEYCSTFMCFLAGKIRDKLKGDTLKHLEDIFGRCGIGNYHEYDSHVFFSGLQSSHYPCWSCESQQWEDVELGGFGDGSRQCVMFHNIKDISSALKKSASINKRYLLPLVSNLALIDSIIPSNVILQMTISMKHTGALNRITDIRKQLNMPATMVMIFVVPVAMNVKEFHFPKLPKYVRMFVTTLGLNQSAEELNNVE